MRLGHIWPQLVGLGLLTYLPDLLCWSCRGLRLGFETTIPHSPIWHYGPTIPWVFGPGNGSPSATNVVLMLVLLALLLLLVLRLFHFTTDRHQTSHRRTDWLTTLSTIAVCRIFKHRRRVSGAWGGGLSPPPNLQPSMDVIRNAKLHSDVLSNRMRQFMRSISLLM